MTDIVQTTHPCNTIVSDNHHRDHSHRIIDAIGNAAMHGLNAEQVTQKAVGDAMMHGLNAEQVTQKEVADATRDVLIDQAAIKQQLGGVVDTIHQDGNFTRVDVKSEGRNLDNKICDVEHHIADTRRETADGFRRTDTLVQETKFELTKQNGEMQRYLSDKLCALNVEVIHQGNATRTAIDGFERRNLEQELQECRLKEACRATQGETVNIINSNLASSLGSITQALTHLSSSLKV